MPSLPFARAACLTAALAIACAAQAESLTSSASSAGSASVGSVSTSLRGSSDSSSGHDKRADGDYRIIEVGAVPDRAGIARLTLQADDPAQRIVLDLPQAILDKERLGPGKLVHARHRDYGIEFTRSDTREAFYLVLADDWYGELAARPVGL